MAATDQQMQQYADHRIRVRAEHFRALINSCRDDKAAIDEIYDRAANGAPWNDNRGDGPPTLLDEQDVLVFNAFITLFLSCIDGTAVTGDVVQLNANLPVFQAACVRPVGA